MSENGSQVERRVAVVVGASSGFGENITRRFAEQGWLTVGLARREDRLHALAAETEGEYEVCDLTDPEQIGVATNNILARHRGIGVLINSAGMAMRERFIDAEAGEVTCADAGEVEKTMKTNYLGLFLITGRLLPGLQNKDPALSGDIINIVSAAGTITNPSSGAYSASKHAQLAASRAMAVDLRPTGVRVHAILPGKADTEGHPQEPSKSLLSKLTRTDVDTVTEVVLGRIGRSSSETYVPKILKAVGVASTIAPVTTTRLVSKAIK